MQATLKSLVLVLALSAGAVSALAQDEQAATEAQGAQAGGASAQQAQERPAAPAKQGSMTREQQQSLERLTGLFILTLLLILAMTVSLIIISLTLRRRLRALEDRQVRSVTQLEDLWWRMEGPNPFEDEGKKKGDEGTNKA